MPRHGPGVAATAATICPAPGCEAAAAARTTSQPYLIVSVEASGSRLASRPTSKSAAAAVRGSRESWRANTTLQANAVMPESARDTAVAPDHRCSRNRASLAVSTKHKSRSISALDRPPLERDLNVSSATTMGITIGWHSKEAGRGSLAHEKTTGRAGAEAAAHCCPSSDCSHLLRPKTKVQTQFCRRCGRVAEPQQTGIACGRCAALLPLQRHRPTAVAGPRSSTSLHEASLACCHTGARITHVHLNGRRKGR